MPWVRIDDDFPQHPKVVQVGPIGMALQIAALCYSNHYLTDGFIPQQVVEHLLIGCSTDVTADTVEKLVQVGMWEVGNKGYMIHDFLEYQPSKAQILSDREQKQAAGRAGGVASAKAKHQQVFEQNPTDAPAESKPVPNPNPNPNPVPDPTPLDDKGNIQITLPGWWLTLAEDSRWGADVDEMYIRNIESFYGQVDLMKEAAKYREWLKGPTGRGRKKLRQIWIGTWLERAAKDAGAAGSVNGSRAGASAWIERHGLPEPGVAVIDGRASGAAVESIGESRG
jgi:hypothetical protein